jgi:hypothetical protein
MPLLATFLRLAGAVDLSASDLLGPIRWEPGSPGRFILDEEEI